MKTGRSRCRHTSLAVLLLGMAETNVARLRSEVLIGTRDGPPSCVGSEIGASLRTGTHGDHLEQTIRSSGCARFAQ